MRLQPKKTRVLLEFFLFLKNLTIFIFLCLFNCGRKLLYCQPRTVSLCRKIARLMPFFYDLAAQFNPLLFLSLSLITSMREFFLFTLCFSRRVDVRVLCPWIAKNLALILGHFFTTTSFLVFRNYRYFYPSASPKGQLQSASMW